MLPHLQPYAGVISHIGTDGHVRTHDTINNILGDARCYLFHWKDTIYTLIASDTYTLHRVSNGVVSVSRWYGYPVSVEQSCNRLIVRIIDTNPSDDRYLITVTIDDSLQDNIQIEHQHHSMVVYDVQMGSLHRIYGALRIADKSGIAVDNFPTIYDTDISIYPYDVHDIRNGIILYSNGDGLRLYSVKTAGLVVRIVPGESVCVIRARFVTDYVIWMTGYSPDNIYIHMLVNMADGTEYCMPCM